jgi:hypothetical protein
VIAHVERNVELARRFFEANDARDIDATISCFDPSAEVHSVFASIDGEVCHGHDGVRSSSRTPRSRP